MTTVCGIERGEVTLHVGPGTFEPVRCDDPREHQLEAEYCEIDATTVETLKICREAGGRVVAVGTTVVRTLESGVDSAGDLQVFKGFANKFIYPPYQFGAVDVLVTNFHLPRSTLLMLVAAFVGRENILDVYKRAVAQG